MNLCRCEKGHFYDKEKYATCPHCSGGSASDEKLTEAFTEDFTVPVAAPVPAPSNPVMTAAPASPKPAPAAPAPMAPPPVVPIPPIAELSASQVTMGMNMAGGDTPTVPLDNPFQTGGGMASAPTPMDDGSDDHTIGFFDDVFSTPPATPSKPVPAAASAPKPIVTQVSTPCVGWLIALSGKHIGTDFRLKVGKNFIGRAPQMDIALTEEKSVSRDRHAIVVYEPKAHLYLVQPGESSSLVYRNNEVVLTPVKLDAYDVITVGDINLMFMPLCGERFNWGDLLDELRKTNKG